MLKTALRSLLAVAVFGATQAFAAPSSLVVCTEASPEGFDIAQYTAAVTADASSETIFERLVDFRQGTTELEPGLAESWEISPDGLTYTFNLRKGVQFHKTAWFTPTRSFNADDVLWSFQRQLDANHPWHKLSVRGFPYAESMGIPDLVERIEKLDDYRVRFVLKHPEAPFLADLAMGFTSIYSAEYADQLLKQDKTNNLNTQPIGTGPFVFERYAKDAQVRFSSHPQYWNGVPAIDKLIFAITHDTNVRQQKLKANDCQIALYPNPMDVPALRANPDIKVLELDSQMTAYVALNGRHAPLGDVRVRQAINLAFDKQNYLNTLFGPGNATPAVAPYPATLWGHDATLQGWSYDPAKAKQLLADAGLQDGFKLAIWTRPGGGVTNPNPTLGAQMLQADLKKVGIEAQIKVVEWGELIKRGKNGEHDVIFFGWAGDNGDPDNFLTPNLSCAAVETGENYSGWCDKQFDGLVREARLNNKQSERADLYRQAIRIFHDQAPWIPLAHPRQFSAVRRDVQGFILSPMGSNNFAKVTRSGS
ncbi:MAG: ABC transporter substrate-binding protein [Pseudomonas sp.]|uniref:ABC transporter substrate-binding protein n=1 Tax=Pseudomonas sp. TaxID=306 RepID=UPI0033936566